METSFIPHQTYSTEINPTPVNHKFEQIENSQPPNNSSMLIITDENPPNWNNDTEYSAHKRHAPPITTSSAPTSPLYTTSLGQILLKSKKQHKKIKTTD
jgi:hypothetical protein